MSDKCTSESENATRTAVMQHVQHLMDNLEKKRDADKQMIEEFRTRMHCMIDQISQKVEDSILKQHDTTNRELKRKLHYLNEVLGQVCCLEKELGQASNVVGHIYKDMAPC